MEAVIYSLLKEKKTSELIEEINKNKELLAFVDSKGVSLLTLSFYFGTKEVSDFILAHRRPKDIYEAVISGINDLAVTMLNNNPALLNSHSPDGFTPLGLAAYFGRVEIAKMLVAKGADPDRSASNSFQVAPIHSAVAANNYEITKLLLEHGANPNAKQQKNVTPLHTAAHLGSARIVALLLKYGGDRNMEMEDGKTAYAMAKEINSEEVIKLLC